MVDSRLQITGCQIYDLYDNRVYTFKSIPLTYRQLTVGWETHRLSSVLQLGRQSTMTSLRTVLRLENPAVA